MKYLITKFGAKPNGKLCTKAIQSAIDACSKAGGGRVIVPAGEFVTGSIYLKDNVELHLELGAVLKASTNMCDYNLLDAYYCNSDCLREEWLGKHLIMAIGCKNVALSGLGIVDGSGNYFFEEPKAYPNMKGYGWRRGFAKSKDKQTLRPGQTICFIECVGVCVTDVTIKNTPCWACFLYGSENISIRGVKIYNLPYFANTDGIDVDCCRFVTISDCIIDTGDDGITFRCSAQRLKDKKPSEFITVTNCVISSSACAFRVGVGVGQIRHVRVSNIVANRSGIVVGIMTSYSNHGCADIEDVSFSNISAHNVGRPFTIDAKVGSVKKVSITNSRFYAIAGCRLNSGEQGEFSEITIKDVDIILDRVKDAIEGKLFEDKGGHAITLNGGKNVVIDSVNISFIEGYVKEWLGQFNAVNCEGLVVKNCSFK